VAKLAVEGDQLHLEGDVLHSSAMALCKSLEAAIDKHQGQALVLNFQRVGRVDSSVLALCLAALRRARTKQVSVTFANLPEQLLAFAKLVGLEPLLANC